MRAVLLLIALSACHGGDTDSDPGSDVPAPDLACPGDPQCAGDDGALTAGAAVASIVPTCFESWTDTDGDFTYTSNTDVFLDCGCDRLCPADAGYPGPDDGEGDGDFQAAWMAGFGTGRAAMGVRGAGMGLRGEGDGLWARAVVLKDGDVSLAFVAMDLVGWFHDDVLLVREEVAVRGLDVDLVVVHSTHTHQATDTMGLWGARNLRSGYTPEHRAFLVDTVADVIAEAEGRAEPVSMVLGTVAASSYDEVKGLANVSGDTRDPYVTIDDVGAARLVGADGDTVATLINWACHPETRADENNWLSSDFVHAVRETVEDGATWRSRQREGVGGVAIYVNGALGGMMTALHVDVTDPDGNVWSDHGFEKADAQGTLVGEMALDALAQGRTIADPSLSFQQRTLFLPVDNIGFQTLFLAGVFERSLWNWDETQPVSDTNVPDVRTEVVRIDIGPLQMLTIPGEVLPELFVGGYDGSRIHSPGVPIVEAGNPNPPDLASAPPPPYWRDAMDGEVRWLVGLGNDELGYVIPPYNFELHVDSPWFEEAPGDHYEETNSLGPATAPTLQPKIDELFSWQR